METTVIMPGQELYRTFTNGSGKQSVKYLYCSERGRLFSCVCDTLDAAQGECEHWLLWQDRRFTT